MRRATVFDEDLVVHGTKISTGWTSVYYGSTWAVPSCTAFGEDLAARLTMILSQRELVCWL